MDFSNTTVNVVKIEAFWPKTIRRVVPKYPKDKPLLLFVAGREARMYLATITIAEFFIGRGVNVLNKEAISAGVDPVPYIWFPRDKAMEAVSAIEKISPVFATWLMFNFDEIF